jgi:hypothetical protein
MLLLFLSTLNMAKNSSGINFTTKNSKAPHQAHFSPLLSLRKITSKN